MDYIFLTGILGSLVLVVGAAWKEKPVKHPTLSVKNWLFAIGAVIMLAFSILQYMAGGSVFYIFLETLVVVAAILMMLDSDDTFDATIISLLGTGLIFWVLMMYESFNTIIFIVGLIGIGFGYAFNAASLRRYYALTIGSLLIAIFSFIEASWIFFWLNVFFAVFSFYYLVQEYKRESGWKYKLTHFFKK
jgi:hypothetical protein